MKRSIYDFVWGMPRIIRKTIVDVSDFVKDPKLILQNQKQIQSIFSEEKSANASIWKKALLYYAISSPRAARKIADNYSKCKIDCMKDVSECWDDDSPIYVCVVKDDLYRVKMAYEHHYALGVRKFVYIDNGSSDGTLEWLLQQNVSVFQTLDAFIMWAKVAWVSKIIDYYGFNKWYLILDSDELFSYPHCEEHDINEYIKYLEKKHRTNDCSFMLDMYAKELFSESGQYKFFDANSYELSSCLHYRKVIGGPRERIFGNKSGIEMLQNKYPLVYYQKGDIYRYHYICPYHDNYCKKITSALLHYKFLPGDYERYIKIAQEGNYANESKLYKDMLKKMEETEVRSFYNDESVEYNNSIDLLKNTLISDWKTE